MSEVEKVYSTVADFIYMAAVLSRRLDKDEYLDPDDRKADRAAYPEALAGLDRWTLALAAELRKLPAGEQHEWRKKFINASDMARSWIK